MTSSLDSAPIAPLIADLYQKADASHSSTRSGPAPHRDSDASVQARADAAEDRYLPIDPGTGRLLYSLIRASRPTVVIEFGTSYGISTLHLAAAVRDNGIGHIYTTEANAKKVTTARATFAQAGVTDVITVLDGDALTTLKAVTDPIGFVLLDGWKDLYLPLMKLLQPQLIPGALIAADNAESAEARDYLDLVRDPANGYTSYNFPAKHQDSMELSSRN
ncbi:putative methyltransferase [Gordonia effusa NBRC 100432]|uniref:Putative methyltransferase n=1 Tax=Gordonia effusa NBRC 100432 TaxID=1077974 RepID=H0R0F3_9ACTN|nr:class I SAM-dependent methyltransferase [Gordonia effusa]GAB18554.1 putative methyltransferase [Gordonia effusa NBRC 100432]